MKNNTVIDKINSNIIAIGFKTTRQEAELRFNRMVNYGAVDTSTELREYSPKFYVFTANKSKVHAYLTIILAGRILKRIKKPNVVARAINIQAKQILDSIPREKFYMFSKNNRYDLPYYRVCMHQDSALEE